MPTRTSEATWNGNLKEGKGTMKVGKGAYDGPYSYMSRFEEGSGTNPEELIGAAHAGCFSMALAGALAKAGHTPESVHTTAKVHLNDGAISKVELHTEGNVPGIDERTFQQHAEDAKKNCPVSKALASVKEITVNAKLTR